MSALWSPATPVPVAAAAASAARLCAAVVTPHYALNTVAVIAGGFLTASSLAFSAHIAGWLGFGGSTAVAVAATAGVVFARRTSAKAGHAVLGLVSLWSLIAALAFHGTAQTWLVFAESIALAATALGALTAHELSTEHIVHALDVRPADTNTTTPQTKRLAA
ncbi:hypothetical protein ABZ468_54125 [Streptomyces sp. NPDC005708]|uniref:hypothetical protein n=1 Tax=Streptomyces sp. NPDC005708 TaxID=3154564 RepID=UPI0033F87C03